MAWRRKKDRRFDPSYRVDSLGQAETPVERSWSMKSRTDSRSPYRTRAGREKIERVDGVVHVYGTVIRSHITPEIIEVQQGDTVKIHLTNLERKGYIRRNYNESRAIEVLPPKGVAGATDVPLLGLVAQAQLAQ